MSISDQLWDTFYQKAVALKKTAPWDWITEEQMFAVKDPYSERIGFCLLMGRLGEHYALNIYLGEEGLLSYYNVAEYEGNYYYDVMFRQKSIMCSFEDRKMLENSEIKRIKKLGFSFRGKNGWPLVRKYDPGLVPWFLEDETDILFLISTIEQTLLLAEEYKDHVDDLSPDDEMLFRTSLKTKNGLRWKSEKLKTDPLIRKWLGNHPLPQPMINQIRLEQLAKTLSGSEQIWIADASFLPSPIKDNNRKRPYFPLVFLIIDEQSQQILHFALLNKDTSHTGIPLEFMNFLEKRGQIPSKIVFVHAETEALLEPIADRLHIEILSSMHEPLFEAILNDFVQFNQG